MLHHGAKKKSTVSYRGARNDFSARTGEYLFFLSLVLLRCQRGGGARRRIVRRRDQVFLSIDAHKLPDKSVERYLRYTASIFLFGNGLGNNVDDERIEADALARGESNGDRPWDSGARR